MSVFVFGGLRWLQIVWVIQLLVADTPLTLWLRVLSYDDHPVLNLVAQEHEKDSKLPAHFRITLPVARKCFAQRCIRLECPSSSPLSSVCSCASTSCRLCFLAVRVHNFGVKHVCFVGTLTFASFCNALHVIKTSWSAFSCCRSCGEILPFRLGLHQSLAVLCSLVFKRLLEQLDCSHIFDSAWRLSSQRRISTAQQYQPICTSRRSYVQHVLLRLGHRTTPIIRVPLETF